MFISRGDQKGLIQALIITRYLIDFLNDGCHCNDINNLIDISNNLFDELNSVNQKKFKEWIQKRYNAKGE